MHVDYVVLYLFYEIWYLSNCSFYYGKIKSNILYTVDWNLRRNSCLINFLIFIIQIMFLLIADALVFLIFL